MRDTLKWLDFAELPISGLHILSENQPKTSIAFDFLVDDKAENVQQALAHHRGACLFERAWNLGEPYPYAKGWLGDNGVVEHLLDGANYV